ncbi:endopeptidase La [Sporanaerobium hydrogeniformans]|uniref:Endopeptidase La n=1 Tax=Sporanaerobium hydrogeniformans TaxID=3072179 RepID=A0AC61DCL6_9FIRM|nr:endopeptidase La [Lachnospiraceae bacterium]PHV70352.1 endopeptidase La [Sporanaerobium hydrogeniformans]
MNKEIKRVPILPLRGITVFPETVMQLDVGREKSLKAIEECMKEDERLLVVAQKDADVHEPTEEDIYTIGTLVEVKQVTKLREGQVKVFIKGEARAKILTVEKDFVWAEIELLEEQEEVLDAHHEAMLRTLGETFEEYARLNSRISEEMLLGILGLKSTSQMMDVIIANMTLEVDKKQDVLACTNKLERMYKVISILENEIEVLKEQNKIYAKVKKNINASQKEYFLREQIKVIQEELGEKDSNSQEIEIYRKRLAHLNPPQEVLDKLEKEFSRLTKLPPTSPENGFIKNYIESVLDIPWGQLTSEEDSLKKASSLLEKEHFGLNKIKERVVEYLAIKKLSPDIEPPILCLVGPPGVGKTSIARSIAEATGRNYVRISLGGLRDEAEIRGHRRTYVGAIPGRFAYGLSQAKSMNPVMVLDEIDKMMGDFRGDPAAALLEVLDSGQNSHFRDHYIELPIDLSKVFFIATANSLSTIPKPLLDRMEIIEVTSYTLLEKMQIAKKYLLPRQLKKHALQNVKISSAQLEYVIEHYTKEAGVRNLERILGKLCRKAAKELVEANLKQLTITQARIRAYLGQETYMYEKKNEKPEIGIVRGLAWTAVGGDTLSIEVNVMKGKGQLELTGQMGDVMKESAKAAMSYIRSVATTLQIQENFHKEYDIHIHIPEGAVPKDGPSAGITMAIAIISALSKKPVRADVAMTGEITIRGRVLAIGGLKEKLLAAKRAGIKLVILPKQNERTIKEIDASILEELEIVYASTMDEVLEHVFI